MLRNLPDKPSSDESRSRGRQLELDLRKALAGQLTPGSGNKSQKGDVRSKLFCAEAKFRWNYDLDRGYYVDLNLEWLETIWHHALKALRVPILAIEWGDGKRVAMIPLCFYVSLEIGKKPKSGLLKQGRSPRLYSKAKLVSRFGSVEEGVWMIQFPDIEISESNWIVLEWEELKQIRRRLQTEPEQKETKPTRPRQQGSKWNKAAGTKSFPSSGKKLGNRGFRKRRKNGPNK